MGGNLGNYYGGGVDVRGGSFNKSGGGVIYGNDASDANKNTAYGNTYGHAVYYTVSSRYFYHDTTLNATDNISTTGALPLNPGETVNGWTMR